MNLSLSERKVTFQISACFGHQSGNDYLILTFSSLYTGTDAGVSWMWSQSIFLSCIPLYSFILMYVDLYKSLHSMCDMLQRNLEKKKTSLRAGLSSWQQDWQLGYSSVIHSQLHPQHTYRGTASARAVRLCDQQRSCVQKHSSSLVYSCGLQGSKLFWNMLYRFFFFSYIPTSYLSWIRAALCVWLSWSHKWILSFHKEKPQMELTRTATGTRSPDWTDRRVYVSPVESIVIFSVFGVIRAVRQLSYISGNLSLLIQDVEPRDACLSIASIICGQP